MHALSQAEAFFFLLLTASAPGLLPTFLSPKRNSFASSWRRVLLEVQPRTHLSIPLAQVARFLANEVYDPSPRALKGETL
jgi:hypothetical protein